MYSREHYRNLLSEDEPDDIEIELKESRTLQKSFTLNQKWLLAVLSASLLASTMVNLLFLIRFHDVEESGLNNKSEFAGLSYDTPYTYVAMNEWSGSNETESDELWNSLNTDGVCISLTDEYASSHDLQLSERFPWDMDRGLYFIKGIHDLHCLKLMRNLTRSLIRGEQSFVKWEHYDHCLNALRQDILCRAEDTPMPAPPGRHIGDQQQLMCRDWKKLVAWTQAPQQNACYKQIGDYKSAIIGIERHAFCPEDSPYREISEAYFRKHGHKNLWTGEDL